MKRFFVFLVIIGSFVTVHGAQALAFGIQTPGETVQSRVDEFTTARKAYEQLKTQGADDATLVIQGRVVLDAMLNVFEIALNNHEDQFDALNASGTTDKDVYDEHKTRIKRVRTWIAEQRDLVKSAETRDELRDRAVAFRNEWKAFRKDAMIARSSILIERAETFLLKAEAMKLSVETIQAKLTELTFASAAVGEAVTVVDTHVSEGRVALQEAQAQFEALRNGADTDSDAAYRSIIDSLKNFRSSLALARDRLGIFRTLARKLAE